jgi:hypothetical protein
MMCCTAAGGGGGGGGAVYLSIGGGDGSATSNTAVALTDCTMTNNTATGLCYHNSDCECVICVCWFVVLGLIRLSASWLLLCAQRFQEQGGDVLPYFAG